MRDNHKTPPRRRAGEPPNSVRIIGGAWRGRRLAVASGAAIRPTPDRVRETLFNWLLPVLPGMRCLDLFAGTGALGLEALSRGAAEALFVDREPRAAAAIEDALGRLGGAGRVLCGDACRLLRGPCGDPFHLAFVDPPFEGNDLGNLCTLLDRGWLTTNAWIYLETSRRNALPELPASWALHRESTAGAVRFALARRGVPPVQSP